MKRTCRRLAALVAGAALSVSAESVARAQQIPPSNGGGLDTHLFRPAMDSKGLFTINGTDILGANDFSFGLVIDYGRHLLRVERRARARAGSSSTTRSRGRSQFNYGLAEPARRRARRARST